MHRTGPFTEHILAVNLLGARSRSRSQRFCCKQTEPSLVLVKWRLKQDVHHGLWDKLPPDSLSLSLCTDSCLALCSGE